MFSYDGKDRPTIEEIRAHPWMQGGVDLKGVRHDILVQLDDKRSNSTAATSREDTNVRGAEMLDLIREDAVQTGRFNDMTDFDIEVVPGLIFDDLELFNEEMFNKKMKVEHVENKYIKLTIPDEEGGENALDTVIKIKFYKLNEGKTRARFIRKQGDIQAWYKTFGEMKDYTLDQLLLQTQEAALI